jgi:hypothetical protein
LKESFNLKNGTTSGGIITMQRRAKYFIGVFGLASDSVCNVTIDNKLELMQLHPTYTIALTPIENQLNPTYEQVLFFADCIAYEHETPTLLFPEKCQFYKNNKIHRYKRLSYQSFFENLTNVLECASNNRLGDLTVVYFRWADTDLPYTKKYSQSEKAIHIYSMGLKQVDPFSEYLCYYRVLENLNNNNTKWISNNLELIRNFNFGTIRTSDCLGFRKINIFSSFKQKACSRLRELQSKMNNEEIAHYLYCDNRCGIAHGRKFRKYDLKEDFFSISKDINIVKLLARISIDSQSICNTIPKINKQVRLLTRQKI